MMTDSEIFVLRSTLTSPFGRKVRMVIDILGLSERVTVVPANTLDQNDTLRLQNPLGKMPCLLLSDGTAIYDSRVIVEFLQEVAGAELLPPRGPERYRTLTLATLADGITDAGLLMVYEGRFRDAGAFSERWLQHQRDKIARALGTFEQDPPGAGKLRLAAIGLACALGYLDWRKPVEWRQDYPKLVRWLKHFSNNEPAYERTRAPDQ